jgi:hypothetical protein
MTRTDHKVIFTALGFLAVILNDVPRDKQALRASAIASLIEGFCKATIPEAFDAPTLDGTQPDSTERLLDTYMAELRDTGSARLSHGRDVLLGMYELLLMQKVRFEQMDFFAFGHDDVIANRILQLAEERLQREQRS